MIATEADVIARLKRILSQIKTDSFGGRDAPVVSLAEGTEIDGAGVLRGALEVHIARRSGAMVLIHRESLDGIADEAGVRDAVAEALSTVLGNHDGWPR